MGLRPLLSICTHIFTPMLVRTVMYAPSFKLELIPGTQDCVHIVREIPQRQDVAAPSNQEVDRFVCQSPRRMGELSPKCGSLAGVGYFFCLNLKSYTLKTKL